MEPDRRCCSYFKILASHERPSSRTFDDGQVVVDVTERGLVVGLGLLRAPTSSAPVYAEFEQFVRQHRQESILRAAMHAVVIQLRHDELRARIAQLEDAAMIRSAGG